MRATDAMQLAALYALVSYRYKHNCVQIVASAFALTIIAAAAASATYTGAATNTHM